MLFFIIITLSLFILYVSSQNTQQYYNYMAKKRQEYQKELGSKLIYAPITTTKPTLTPIKPPASPPGTPIKPSASTPPGTGTPIKPPPATGIISRPECVDFISKFEKPICVCKNVMHAKCRDSLPNYVPVNDDEKRCVEYVKTFKGDICECMNNFHEKCQ